LQPGGRLYVSVPDMDILAALFLDKESHSVEEQFFVMRMIFGGHVDAYDHHKVGLNESFLASFLIHAGFKNICRVGSFGLFDDSSEGQFKGTPISLNVIAEKD
jgi:predicted SAM-dependent methyltransferase